MRNLGLCVALLAIFALVGCTSRVHSTPATPSSYKTPSNYDPKTRPYKVMGKTYYPLQTAQGYDEVGLASWYGEDFHGKKTANGYIYNMYGVSAAHKTLPLGTEVRVTNLENGKKVNLVINDRGPFVRGRIIDLSYGAAKALGTVDKGVVRVRIQAIGTGPPVPVSTQQVTAPVKMFHVRVGAFAVKDNAMRVYRQLVESGYAGATISVIFRNGQRLHVVQAGSFTNRDNAEAVLRNLKREFPSSYIVS